MYAESIWQEPLSCLLQKIQDKHIDFGALQHFHEWIHTEQHPHPVDHVEQASYFEREWQDNFSKATHNLLGQWPGFLRTSTAESPWLETRSPEVVTQEARCFIHAYKKAAQARFSAQQCHWHPWNPSLKARAPLAGCKKKGAPNKCKHGFPKKTNVLSRVICRGNARRFQVSTKGRRNALGLWLGAREDAWLSGTMTAFSVWLFGNSHTAVNYRVPLCPATHDPECQRNCLQQATAGKLQRLMQQASHPLLYGVPAKATTSRTERTPASRQATAFPPHQRWQRSDRGPLSQGGQSRVWRP